MKISGVLRSANRSSAPGRRTKRQADGEMGPAKSEQRKSGHSTRKWPLWRSGDTGRQVHSVGGTSEGPRNTPSRLAYFAIFPEYTDCDEKGHETEEGGYQHPKRHRCIQCITEASANIGRAVAGVKVAIGWRNRTGEVGAEKTRPLEAEMQAPEFCCAAMGGAA